MRVVAKARLFEEGIDRLAEEGRPSSGAPYFAKRKRSREESRERMKHVTIFHKVPPVHIQCASNIGISPMHKTNFSTSSLVCLCEIDKSLGAARVALPSLFTLWMCQPHRQHGTPYTQTKYLAWKQCTLQPAPAQFRRCALIHLQGLARHQKCPINQSSNALHGRERGGTVSTVKH